MGINVKKTVAELTIVEAADQAYLSLLCCLVQQADVDT